jgi:hypothetical protein
MGKHSSHRTHPNSKLSLDQFKPGPRETAVILAVRLHGPLSDRQVAEKLGFADMNAVRPVITKLRDRGVLEEGDTVMCPVTRRRVRTVKIAAGQKVGYLLGRGNPDGTITAEEERHLRSIGVPFTDDDDLCKRIEYAIGKVLNGLYASISSMHMDKLIRRAAEAATAEAKKVCTPGPLRRAG